MSASKIEVRGALLKAFYCQIQLEILQAPPPTIKEVILKVWLYARIYGTFYGQNSLLYTTFVTKWKSPLAYVPPLA